MKQKYFLIIIISSILFIYTGLDADENIRGYLDKYNAMSRDIVPKIKPISLPLDDQVVERVRMLFETYGSKALVESFRQRGFVVMRNIESSDFQGFLQCCNTKGFPVMLTSDLALYATSTVLGEMSRYYACEYLPKKLKSLVDGMVTHFRKDIENTACSSKEAMLFVRRYIEILDLLVNGRTISDDPLVAKEILSVMHAKYDGGDILGIVGPDYSCFKPPSMFTTSTRLEAYHRAMTWLKESRFLIKFEDPRRVLNEQPTDDERLRTEAACILSIVLTYPDTKKDFDDIRRHMLYLWGLSYPLNIEVLAEYRSKFVTSTGSIVFDKKTLDLMIGELVARYHAQRAEYPHHLYSLFPPSREADLFLNSPGFSILDSYASLDEFLMESLSWPNIGDYKFKEDAEAKLRYRVGTPIDIMQLLGSTLAKDSIEKSGKSQYENYADALNRSRSLIADCKPNEWHATFGLGALDAIRTLFVELPEGYQSFQRHPNWRAKRLNTALGAWCAFNYDRTCNDRLDMSIFQTDPKMPDGLTGYVEPEIVLYEKLISLLDHVPEVYKSLDIPLPDRIRSQIDSVRSLVAQMLEISIVEVEGRDYRDLMKAFLASIDSKFRGIGLNLTSKTKYQEPTLVIRLKSQKLREYSKFVGVNYLLPMFVAVRTYEGEIVPMMAPFFDYYELWSIESAEDILEWSERLQISVPPENEWFSLLK